MLSPQNRSSTESELVGLHDVMLQIIWTRNFIQAQGYENSINIVGQDNQSAMLLEQHGKASSSSKWTHHIEICYHFVADHISSGDLEVTYVCQVRCWQNTSPSHCKATVQAFP